MHALPNLNYEYDALSRSISADIMELHHSKHHQAYVDKLNAAVSGTDVENTPLEDLLGNLGAVPDNIRTAVRNHGGGHLNHSQFWQWMSPDGGGQPNGALLEAIETEHGSYQEFVDKFTAASLGIFGSGWCWLLDDMKITTTANQDTPLSDGKAPILGLDVWEHAYYLDYKNKRDDYIASWWDVVDWQFVAERYR